jgi:cold shock CspA family protein
MSAPKKIETRDRLIFDFKNPNLSPGISPTVYAIQNFPIESSKDIFFNSSISISELKNLGEVDEILEEDHDPGTPLSGYQKYSMWISKSTASRPKRPTSFHSEIQLLKSSCIIKGEEMFQEAPPGFDNRRQHSSAEADCVEVPVDSNKPSVETNQVLLLQPPKVGLVKRENRGKFNEEEVSYDRYSGKLKFYQLKKRFGFISLDEDSSDVFLCEDDLILSGISFKKFKEDVFNRCEIRLEFHIKKYLEGEKEKRKAINVTILEVINNNPS